MAITRGYCTLAEVRDACRLPPSDTSEDSMLERIIEAASRRIDGYCGRFFYQVTNTALDFFPVTAYVVSLPDLVSSNITVKTDNDGDGVFETTWSAGQYRLEPTTTVLQNRPFDRLVAVQERTFPVYLYQRIPTVQVTGTWGWSSIPDDVQQACVILSMRLYSRYNSPLGVAGFGEMGAITVRTVDPDVRELLNPYQIMAVA